MACGTVVGPVSGKMTAVPRQEDMNISARIVQELAVGPISMFIAVNTENGCLF